MTAPWHDALERELEIRFDGLAVRGGMATVYRASDEALARRVAVKILEVGASDSDAIRRFEREARAVAMLSHPNIAQVFAFKRVAGAIALVMPWYPQTLQQRLRSGRLDVGSVRRLAVSIGGALAAAHESGIVHRDVKPSNILIDERGAFLLSDFGIASVEGEATSLTGTGQTPGSVGYVAPEVLRGGDQSTACDVYALGVTLFEAATGRRPFAGVDPASVVYQHVHEPVPEPEAADPVLNALIVAMLAKDPRDRPPASRLGEGGVAGSASVAFSGDEMPTADHAVAPAVDPASVTQSSILARIPRPRGRAARRAVAAGGLLATVIAAWWALVTAGEAPRDASPFTVVRVEDCLRIRSAPSLGRDTNRLACVEPGGVVEEIGGERLHACDRTWVRVRWEDRVGDRTVIGWTKLEYLEASTVTASSPVAQPTRTRICEPIG